MKRKGWLVVAVGALACLGLGVLWTVRLDMPSPRPWWYGKKAVVRAEVWEPGHTMATFAMTVPKGALDTMYGLGIKGEISLDGRSIRLRDVWHELQRLPRGRKLELEQDGATVTLWIEVPAPR
jgi:hypothetical protein